MLKTLAKNTTGRDFFVGDLHGHLQQLMRALEAQAFDPARDRLIAVGDLVDRGPDSQQCLELIGEPWFHAVRGNHEDMMIDCFHGRGSSEHNYVDNGGQWFLDAAYETQARLVALAETLPMFLEVELGDKRIGVVHADFVEVHWIDHETLRARASKGGDTLIERALWGRSRIARANTRPVSGIDLIVCGHTPLEHVELLGNVLYIDTGACYFGYLSVLSGDEVLGFCEAKARDEPALMGGLWRHCSALVADR